MEAFRGGDEVKVTVASSKPYVKEMTATVVLPGTNGGVEMTVTDLGQDFGAVSVTLYNTGGQACTGVLDWPGRDKLYELKQIADPTARAEAAAQAADALLLAPDPTWEGAVKSDGRVTIPGGGVVSVVLVKRDAQQTFNKDSGFRFTPDTPTTPTEGSN